MAFKEFCLVSTLTVIAIINYNVQECESVITIEQINTNYLNTQRDLYQLQELGMNVMSDSQKLYDLLNEYYNKRIDKSAVDAAQAELLRTKADWFQKAMQYHYDTTLFEPATHYPYGPDVYPNTPAAPAVAPLNPAPLSPAPLSPAPDTDTNIYIVN